MKIGNVEVPVRFAMVPLMLYFEEKGKNLLSLGSEMQFSEILDCYWIAIQTGCRRENIENPFPSKESFFDALDDNPEVMQALGEEMSKSFAQMTGEKNVAAPKKRR